MIGPIATRIRRGTGQRNGFAITSWAIAALILTSTQTIAYRVGFANRGPWLEALQLPWRPHEGRIAWDSGLYLRVAERGYRLPEGLEAGFPGYALSIRLLHGVGLGYESAAVTISLLSGCAAALLSWKWFALMGLSDRDRRVALWMVLLYPYSFVLFGVAYSDALLLALVMGAFVAVETEHYLLAGLSGAAATATRPTAMLLVAALVLLVLQRERVVQRWSIHVDRLRPRHLLVLLSGAGIGSYMLFLGHHAGDPLYFLTVQTTDYGHPSPFDPAAWLKWSFLSNPAATVHHLGDVLNELVSTLLVVAVIVAGPRIGRRLGWGYAVLGYGIVASVWVTAGWLTPAGRYLLPVIPALAALTAPMVAAERWRTAAVLVPCALGSVVMTIGFAGWFDLHW